MGYVKGCHMEILGQRLRALRKARHLTQQDMAAALDISFNSYCRYEKNEREPMAPVVAAMADYFHVSADYLLGRTENPQGPAARSVP